MSKEEAILPGGVALLLTFECRPVASGKRHGKHSKRSLTMHLRNCKQNRMVGANVECGGAVRDKAEKDTQKCVHRVKELNFPLEMMVSRGEHDWAAF